jgi:hypothetical protein
MGYGEANSSPFIITCTAGTGGTVAGSGTYDEGVTVILSQRHTDAYSQAVFSAVQNNRGYISNSNKRRDYRSRYQAAKLVNKELLSLYYAVRKYVSQNSRGSECAHSLQGFRNRMPRIYPPAPRQTV